MAAKAALGETSSTAYRGDRGLIAYDHSQTAHAPSTAQKNSDITKAEIEAKLTGTISSHIHNRFTSSSIGSDADLNNYQTEGFYYCGSDATVATMSNAPVSQAFSLVVLRAAGVVQIFYKYNSSDVYIRGFYGSSWTAWRLMVDTSRTIAAGDGLSGGGTLAANRTITLGTPSNITLSSTNSVATTSHTHNFSLGGTASQYLNGATALVTIPTVTGR